MKSNSWLTNSGITHQQQHEHHQQQQAHQHQRRRNAADANAVEPVHTAD